MRPSFSLLLQLLSLLLVLSVFTGSGSALRTASWMGDLMPQLANRTLQQVSLPGTHDSASFSVVEVFTGLPKYINELIKIADELHVNVSTIMDNWAKTQDRDFYQQFADGIRYVDIRACFYTPNQTWLTHHNMVLGNPLLVELQDTARFLSAFPSEVVVLEITHIAEDSCDGSDARALDLVQMIRSNLGTWLYPTANGFKETVGQMVAKNTRAVVTFESHVADNLPDIWPGTTIVNSYANSDDLSKMEAYNNKQLAFFHNTTFAPNQIFKMSWTLTPNEDTVLKMLLPGHPKTLIQLADTAAKPLSTWYSNVVQPQALPYPVLAHILIIDHYETSDIVNIVLRNLPQ